MTTNKITTSPVFRHLFRVGSIFIAAILLVFIVSSFKVMVKKEIPSKLPIPYYTEINWATAGVYCAPSNIIYSLSGGSTNNWCGAFTTIPGRPTSVSLGLPSGGFLVTLSLYPTASYLTPMCIGSCADYTVCTPSCSPVTPGVQYGIYLMDGPGVPPGTYNVLRIDIQ